MLRATHYSLLARVYSLNDVLDRPIEQFASKVGEPTKFSVGHIALGHDSSGYNLEEQMSEAGAVEVIACGHTAHEMDVLITGIMKGIGFRTMQFAEQLLQKEKQQQELFNSPAA